MIRNTASIRYNIIFESSNNMLYYPAHGTNTNLEHLYRNRLRTAAPSYPLRAALRDPPPPNDQSTSNPENVQTRLVIVHCRQLPEIDRPYRFSVDRDRIDPCVGARPRSDSVAVRNRVHE